MKRSRARTSDPHEHRIPLKVRSQRERGVVYGETTRFSFAHRRSGHIGCVSRGLLFEGCCADLAFYAGRIRYSQERRFAWRGAVNAVPENCSAYSLYGHLCGEFCPRGKAPGSASVANSFPKPVWYSRSMERLWLPVGSEKRISHELFFHKCALNNIFGGDPVVRRYPQAERTDYPPR